MLITCLGLYLENFKFQTKNSSNELRATGGSALSPEKMEIWVYAHDLLSDYYWESTRR